MPAELEDEVEADPTRAGRELRTFSPTWKADTPATDNKDGEEKSANRAAEEMYAFMLLLDFYLYLVVPAYLHVMWRFRSSY